MKAKNLKRSFLLSVLALVMSVSMLVGTTFAWFTDSITNTKNKIMAGNLDVELEYLDKDGKWQSVDGSDDVIPDTLWEPGHTEVVYLKVSNLGSLALKYQLGVSVFKEVTSYTEEQEEIVLSNFILFEPVHGVNGETNPFATRDAARAEVGKLAQPISLDTGYVAENSINAGAEAQYVALVLYMPEEVGNAANHATGEATPEITLGIELYATQQAAEEDSFGASYDENATNREIILTKDELVSALAAGGDINLAADIEVNGNLNLKAGTTLYGNGHTLSNVQLYMGDGATVDGVVFEGVSKDPLSHIYATNASVTIKNCTFDSPEWDAIQAITDVADKTIVIDGCTFKNTQNTAWRYVHVEVRKGDTEDLRLSADNGVKLVLTNNHFEKIDSVGEDAITVAALNPANVTVSGNTATATTKAAAEGEYWFAHYSTGAWVNYDVELPVALVTPENVQTMIDGAAAGDVIKLSAGKYDTAIMINVNDITIEGSEGAIVDCIRVNGKEGITIKNVTFDAAGAEAGFDAYKGGTQRQTANIISGEKGGYNGARNLVIDGCTFTGTFANGGVAIAFADRARKTTQSDNVTVQNCTFEVEGAYYFAYGYYTGNSQALTHGFTFTGNTFKTETAGQAIYLGRIQANTTITVKNNTFAQKATLADAVYTQPDGSYVVTLDTADNTFATVNP